MPVIVPIILYNGIYNWNAPLEFKGMLNKATLFGEPVVNFKYSLIDINRFQKNELLKISNLISSVFLLDQDIQNTEELFIRLKELTNTINDLSPYEHALFKVWLKRIVSKRFPKKNRKKIENIIDKSNPKEAKAMISNLGRYLQRFMDEGREKIWQVTRIDQMNL